jgi:hypothetical protein
MTTTEDVVRAATRAYGETVAEIRPLDLTRPVAGTRPRRPRRFPAWVAPVTAAAVVMALAVSLVLVRDIPNGPVVPAKPPATAVGGVPRYYADPIPAGENPWSDLVIGDLFTGARLATIAPPSGSTFANVTGAADDRTFVADTMLARHLGKPSSVTWYLVRITPGAWVPDYQALPPGHALLDHPGHRPLLVRRQARDGARACPARPPDPGPADLLGGHGHAAAHLVHDGPGRLHHSARHRAGHGGSHVAVLGGR